MLGAAEELQAHGVFVDAHVSRQMKDYLPTCRTPKTRGLLGDTVVVHLGTNGPFSDDTLSTFMAPCATSRASSCSRRTPTASGSTTTTPS